MGRRSVSILGATGSIGDSTLDLIRFHRDKFDVKVLAAGKNIDKFIGMANEFKPQYAAIADESLVQKLRANIPDSVEIVSVAEASMVECDWTMAAIVGTAGLIPTMNAINNSKVVAFASKECLVAAGGIMMNAVKKSGCHFLPVDSEHNAIFQVLNADKKDDVNRLILTASGGPFRNRTLEEMHNVTPQQAVAHPTWSMGAKISVDSATLMNKALEVIEAHYLFDMPSEKIDVVIHPQSIIHSMVEYCDGSILSQMGPSDMRTPIAYCLGWPHRIQTPCEKLDLFKNANLTFEKPDSDKFLSLKFVRDVLKEGQAASIIFNAANEIANKSFLDGQIGFTQIYNVIGYCLENIQRTEIITLDDVIDLDTLTRTIANNYISDFKTKANYA